MACCGVGGTECSSACLGSLEGGHLYLHYLHHSLPQVNSREGTQLHPSTESEVKLKVRLLSCVGGLWTVTLCTVATRLLCPWDFPGKNTGVGCHCLLQGIFPTQGSNLCLLHCRQIVYHLSHQESLKNSLVDCRNVQCMLCKQFKVTEHLLSAGHLQSPLRYSRWIRHRILDQLVWSGVRLYTQVLDSALNH